MKKQGFLLYSKDWLIQTAHLTTCEKNCYMQLLIYLSKNGSIENDLDILKSICFDSELNNIKEVLFSLFMLKDNNWIIEYPPIKSINIQPTYLYYFILSKNGERFIKIGITNNISRRKKEYRDFGFSINEIGFEEFKYRKLAKDAESTTHKFFQEFKYNVSLENKFTGFTECFDVEIKDFIQLSI